METEKPSNKAVIGLIVVVLLVAIATTVSVLGNNKQEDTASTSPSVSPTIASSSSATSSSTVKDGTYTATGIYQTPGGQESIGVTVTLSGGNVTDAKVTQEGKTDEAQEYQAAFASAFKSQVVGKKISDVSLSRVAGSSLTPRGFNSAISDIENQAQA